MAVRQRANYLSAIARAASTAGDQLGGDGARGVRIYVNCTVAPGTWFARLQLTPPTTPFIVLDGSGNLGVGLFALVWYPGIVAGTGESYAKSLALPPGWQVAIMHNLAGNYTYGVDYELLR